MSPTTLVESVRNKIKKLNPGSQILVGLAEDFDLLSLLFPNTTIYVLDAVNCLERDHSISKPYEESEKRFTNK
jgi:hypothetical protein